MNNKNEKIRARLTQAFIMVTAIVSIAAVVAVIALLVISNRYNYALKNYGFALEDIAKAETAFAEARSALRGAIGYDEESTIYSLKSSYYAEKAEFEEYYSAIEEICVGKEEKAACQEVITALDGYWTLSDAIVEEGAVTDRTICAQAQEKAINELAPKAKAVEEGMTKLMDANVSAGKSLETTIAIIEVILLILVIVTLAVGASVGIKMGNTIAKSVEKPLSALGKRLEAFSHGDLGSAFPPCKRRDEIADITDDCAAMAVNLSEIIADMGRLLEEMANGNFNIHTNIGERYEGEFEGLLLSIRKLNRQLDTTLRQISDASIQVTEGSGQLANSAQDLAEGATDQAGAVEQLTATIEDVTNISKESAESAKAAAIKAKGSAENAGKSREDMLELSQAMQRITDTSREIENIIGTIEDIASQTNLLSLNASIEAARAGEAGRGFAVVADQIGKLATDSAQAAVTTKYLIEHSLEEIDKGNQIVQITMETIAGVLAGMEEFAEVASNSAKASQTQADMLEQIEDGIEQISTVVQSNSAASQETSAISEELSAEAISLKEMVEAFRLRDN